MPLERFDFPNAEGQQLAGLLDTPLGEPRAYALFAHCFTCGKDVAAAQRIAAALTARGIAVLRFDFTGLGASAGEFANTTFSSNVADLVAAADHLRRNRRAPALLIGHSLGGAAILAAAGSVPEARAVATIAACCDPKHVAEQNLTPRIANLRKALLVFHSPIDQIVGIDNASCIFLAAKHPKSFVSLDGADHLLSRRSDAVYVANVIAAWAERYLDAAPPVMEDAAAGEPGVTVSETRQGKFQQLVQAGTHRMLADEPTSVGGLDSGLSPYDLLLAGLGACTAMTLRLYAERKMLPLERVRVHLTHAKIHAEDCETCETAGGMIDRIDRVVTFDGDLDDAQRQHLLEIADKCPVHRTLTSEIEIRTVERREERGG